MRRLDDFTQQKTSRLGFDILIDTGTIDLIYLSNISNQFSDKTPPPM